MRGDTKVEQPPQTDYRRSIRWGLWLHSRIDRIRDTLLFWIWGFFGHLENTSHLHNYRKRVMMQWSGLGLYDLHIMHCFRYASKFVHVSWSVSEWNTTIPLKDFPRGTMLLNANLYSCVQTLPLWWRTLASTRPTLPQNISIGYIYTTPLKSLCVVYSCLLAEVYHAYDKRG